MAAYDPQAYWTGVAEHIAARPDGDTAAGDSSPYIRYQSAAVTNRFIARMPVAGRSVLELGCGPGGKLADVLQLGPSRLVGADLSPKMVEIAKERFSGSGVDIAQLERGPYPFADGEFDLAYTCTVLHHNPDSILPEILGELARVTSSDLFLIETTARERVMVSDAFHLRPVDDYATKLEEHGFRLRSAQPLQTYASELFEGFALRLAHTRFLRRPPYAEGAPVAPLRRRLGQWALPITRRLDRLVPQRRGLTMMHFSRERPAATPLPARE